tara:strand:- start:119 stop:535 length:417 start_codon:yes stop_codon:yes gene_type:complete
MSNQITTNPLSDSKVVNTEKKEKVFFRFSFDHGETGYLMDVYYENGTMDFEEDEIHSENPKAKECEKFIFEFVETHLVELRKVTNDNCWTTFEVNIDPFYGEVEVSHSYWFGEGSHYGEEKTFRYNPINGMYKKPPTK